MDAFEYADEKGKVMKTLDTLFVIYHDAFYDVSLGLDRRSGKAYVGAICGVKVVVGCVIYPRSDDFFQANQCSYIFEFLSSSEHLLDDHRGQYQGIEVRKRYC